MTDDEVGDLATAMRGMALAMDQRKLCVKTLAGRSLTCSQAGTVLGNCTAGIAQRMLAREVLHGHIRGLPQGLEDALAPISAELRSDVKAALLAPAGGSPNIVRSITAPARVKESMLRPDSSDEDKDERGGAEISRPAWQKDWPECVERLRARVGEEEMSAGLYGDLADTFQALGLGPLPPPSARGSSAASTRTPVDAVASACELPSRPSPPSAALEPKAAPQAPTRLPAPLPPAPVPGGSLPRSLKVSALPAPPVRRAAEAAEADVGANEGNLTVDDVADGMSEESV